MQNYKQELDKIFEDFKNEWNTTFSFIFIRKMLEFTVKNMYCLIFKENDIKSKVIFGDLIKWIEKYAKKHYPHLIQDDIFESLNELQNMWRYVSKNVHCGTIYEKVEINKQVLQQWATRALKNCKNLISLIIEQKQHSGYDIVVLEKEEIQQIVNDSFQEQTIVNLRKEIDVQNELILSLQEKVTDSSKAYATLESFKQQLAEFKLSDSKKTIQINELNKIIQDFNNIASHINELEKDVTLNQMSKIKKLINKDIFLTIIFGEDKFRSFFNIDQMLLEGKVNIDPIALENWKLRQEKFDELLLQIENEVSETSEELTFSFPSENATLVQNNPNIRYIESKNAHIVFLEVSGTLFKEAKTYNFIFNQSFIRQVYEWHLYSCWVKGINFVHVVVVNKDTNEYQVLPRNEIKNHELKFKNYDKNVTRYIKELIKNGN